MADYSQRLTEMDLAQLWGDVAKLTPGDYDLGRSDTQTKEDAIAWFTRCLEVSDRTDLFAVFTEPNDAPTSWVLALTGNGPNSENNARAICNILRAVPYLLAEVQHGRHPSGDAE